MENVIRAGNAARRSLAVVRSLALLAAAIAAAVIVSQVRASSSSTAAPALHVHPDGRGEDEGALPRGTTVFDDDVPGVARLDPELRDALRRAARDAGIPFHVDSGWRSPAYQRRLLGEATEKYGSAAEAARWVASPETSAHVSGDAVDLGPAQATAWLSAHGSAYGLCRVYGNEPWHYELRPAAVTQGCPPMYADAAHDPRMRRP